MEGSIKLWLKSLINQCKALLKGYNFALERSPIDKMKKLWT